MPIANESVGSLPRPVRPRQAFMDHDADQATHRAWPEINHPHTD